MEPEEEAGFDQVAAINVNQESQVESEEEGADVTWYARNAAGERRQEAIELYRQNLLVSESGIQANRLILNLEQVLAKKAKKGEDVSGALKICEESRQLLVSSLRTGDAEAILDVESRVEQATLTHDALYLENEESRRVERRINLDEKANTHWMSSQSSRLIQIMRGDMKGEKMVTRAERRSCISQAAWAFAISGMVIAIAFLIVDFYSAQTNPVLRTNLIAKQELTLPQTTFCMGVPNIGSFREEWDLTLRGKPLFGVSSFANIESGENMRSDEAHRSKFEHVILGNKSCHGHISTFSQTQMMLQGEEENPKKQEECFSCFRVRRSQDIKLTSERAKEIGRPPVQVKMAKSNLINYCFTNVSHYHDVSARDSILDQIKENADELAGRGILRGGNGTILSGLEHMKGINPYYVKFIPDELGKEISFLCNVYFFSGYFYPKTDDIDIKYVYNDPNSRHVLGWYPEGDGPYHRVYYHTENIVGGQGNVNSRLTMRDELQDIAPEAVGARDGVFIYAVDNSLDRLPNINDLASILSQRVTTSVEFTRSEDHGNPGYKTKVNFGRLLLPQGTELFSEYGIEMGFSGFGVEEIFRRPATSVAEFLTDCFEYAGLFTGLCAYTVVVAPARMYLKRLK